MLGKMAKAKKVTLPAVVAGDVMGIMQRDGAVQLSLNGQLIEAAASMGSLLWDLGSGASSGLQVVLRRASVEVLADEDVEVARGEVARLRAEEQQLEEHTQAEEQERRAWEARAAEVWARVLAPPRQQPATRQDRRQQWLHSELADLAKPLHHGAAPSPWALVSPPLLLKAFTHLEATDVVPLAQTCRVWRRLAVRSSLMERVQLHCFYTKAGAEEDVLGFGVSATYHDDGNLKSVNTELDALSATAFYDRKLRRGVWGDEFTHFLPLMLSAEHEQRAMPDLERTLAAIARGQTLHARPKIGCSSEFEPWMALVVIPQLMNSFVVSLMSAGGDGSTGGGIVPRHASERALLGYCSFHHMLLALCRRHPSIVQVANEKLQRFIAGERSKSKVPDLGQLIVYLAVSDALQWRDVVAAIVDESHVRGALWLLRAQPKLARDIHDKVRLSCTFTERLTSVRLLMFQAFFLCRLARPSGESLAQGLARYNRQFGLPTAPQKEMLVQATRAILAVSSWPEVYRRLGLRSPGPEELALELREALNRSAELGYHNARALGPFGRFAKGGAGESCQEKRVGVQKSLQQAFGLTAEHPREHSNNPRYVLTALEESEAKKIDKILREIARLEERAARGDKLDVLQYRKMHRRQELEDTPVMRKLRAGYLRLA